MKTTLPFLPPLAASIATLLAFGGLAHGLPPLPYILTEVASVGDAVPGGSAGELFTKFYTPSINNEGDFGLYVGTRDTAGLKRTTFLDINGAFTTSTRLLTKDEVLADDPTTMLRSLKNPAFNAQGSLGLILRLGNVPPAISVSSLNDLAVGFLPGSPSIVAGNGGAPGSPIEIVARENSPAPGTGTTPALFNSFKTVVLGDQEAPVATASGGATNGLEPTSTGTLFFTASLKRVVPTITSANDYGVWTYSTTEGTDNLLLEGNTYNFDSANHLLKAFKTLSAASLGFAQGHSVRGRTLVALARFTTPPSTSSFLSIIKAAQGSPVQAVVSKGDAAPGVADVTYTSFGIPSLSANGTTTVMAKLSDSTFRIESILGNTTTTRLNSTDPVPDIATAVLTSIRTPQVNAENDFVTLGKISDLDSVSTVVTATTDEVVIGNLAPVTPPPPAAGTNGGTVASYQIFAREGAVAPGAGTATFDTFRSILLPDRELGGVLISASLTVDGTTVTSANNDGIWGFTTGAGLQKIVREGDNVTLGGDAVTVKKILAFKSVSGSADHQRSGGGSGRALVLLQTVPTLPAIGPAVYRVVAIERGSIAPL